MDVLDHLIKEHREVEQLLEKLAASAAGHDREQMLAELGDALDMHMEVEERDVYPIVEDHLGEEKSAAVEHEHNNARNHLSRVADHVNDVLFAEAIEALTNDIQHHVAEEENKIFPTLRRVAADEIAALGDPEDIEDEVEAQIIEEERVT